ncbi:MAG: hypothetical protein B6244_04580 [Candidatus Cloacimonetes bacterium 4572_55]|nr:MAG: hypothetical protein B6244_04580 [Candidatus Cloacimonetes bacterium 4572_55]
MKSKIVVLLLLWLMSGFAGFSSANPYAELIFQDSSFPYLFDDTYGFFQNNGALPGLKAVAPLNYLHQEVYQRPLTLDAQMTEDCYAGGLSYRLGKLRGLDTGLGMRAYYYKNGGIELNSFRAAFSVSREIYATGGAMSLAEGREYFYHRVYIGIRPELNHLTLSDSSANHIQFSPGIYGRFFENKKNFIRYVSLGFNINNMFVIETGDDIDASDAEVRMTGSALFKPSRFIDDYLLVGFQMGEKRFSYVLDYRLQPSLTVSLGQTLFTDGAALSTFDVGVSKALPGKTVYAVLQNLGGWTPALRVYLTYFTGEKIEPTDRLPILKSIDFRIKNDWNPIQLSSSSQPRTISPYAAPRVAYRIEFKIRESTDMTQPVSVQWSSKSSKEVQSVKLDYGKTDKNRALTMDIPLPLAVLDKMDNKHPDQYSTEAWEMTVYWGDAQIYRQKKAIQSEPLSPESYQENIDELEAITDEKKDLYRISQDYFPKAIRLFYHCGEYLSKQDSEENSWMCDCFRRVIELGDMPIQELEDKDIRSAQVNQMVEDAQYYLEMLCPKEN